MSTNVPSNAPTQTFAPGASSDGSTLAAFTSGSGNFLVRLPTATGVQLSSTGGNTSAVQTTTASGALDLTYDYTPTPVVAAVPEPATCVVMLLGFGLIGAIARRRRPSIGRRDRH